MKKSPQSFEGPIYVPDGDATRPYWWKSALLVVAVVLALVVVSIALGVGSDEPADLDPAAETGPSDADASIETSVSPSRTVERSDEPATTATPSAPAKPSSASPDETMGMFGELYRVERVVDGDTVRVIYNGRSESVRLIGIDTPESVDPNSPIECFGPEASRRAVELLSNAQVHLVRDGGQADRDPYERLLRFVYLADGSNLNELLVREGFATFEPQYPIDEPWRSELDAAEDDAMASGAGLWSACS